MTTSSKPGTSGKYQNTLQYLTQELLFKMWQMGITGSLWSWIQCYLLMHTHYVSIDGANFPVLSGVPQGSPLVYINDLPNSITYTAFADDIKVNLVFQRLLSVPARHHLS